VSVDAEYSVVVPPWAPDPAFDPCDLPSFDLTAGVGYGMIFGTSSPSKRTEIVQIQHPTDPAVTIPIPPFSTAFTVLLQAIGGTTASALVEQVAFGTAYRTRHDFVSPTTETGFHAENAIPLWNGAEFLTVTSTNGADQPLVATVIFDLAL